MADNALDVYLNRPDAAPPFPMPCLMSEPRAPLPNYEFCYVCGHANPLGLNVRFRVEGDRVTISVDGAWSEVYRAEEQVRFFAVEGDRLTIRTPEQPSGVAPGRTIVSTLVFEREG